MTQTPPARTTPTSPRRGQALPTLLAHSARSSALATLLVCLAGCASSMDEVDRRVAEMLQNKNAAIEANKAPERAYADLERAPKDPDDRRRALKTTPATTNPTADTLTYKVQDEARDVSKKLEGYAAGAYGSDTAGTGLEGALELNLAGAWRQTQKTAREYLNSEEDYILAVIRLLTEQHRWEPRLFNDTTFTANNSWDNGEPTPALSVINTLRAQKRLPYGGQVEASWITNASQDLREQVSAGYTQSSSLVLSANVPLLRGSGNVAREPLIQAERDLIYQARTFERFRRSFLVNIANDYFQLIQLQAQIANQERSLKSLRLFRDGTQARVDAGRIPAFNVSIAENDVLNAQASLASLREQYILQLDRFKVRLGLDVASKVIIKPLALEIPLPDTTLDEATRAALEYRLDLQNARDRVDDAKRGVDNAENNLLPDLNVGGRATVPTDTDRDVGGLSFSPRDATVEGTATLSLPLDRQIEKYGLRQATIALQQRARAAEQLRDNVVVGVRGALRNIDLAAFQFKLAEQQVEINRRRLEEQLLKIDTVEPRDVVQSENDLLAAENRRDQAKTNLRNAVLNYLLESDQLRVAPDGMFQPLPGMPQVPVKDNPAKVEERPMGAAIGR
ncbi:MAG: TolC family protein [Phycisphaerales bacterium]|nr:TolC family protein [Phycisphaerales bacterium]